MNKLYLQAIKDLPEAYIDEETDIVLAFDRVIAANPKLHPIHYLDGKWLEIPTLSKDDLDFFRTIKEGYGA